MELLKLVVAEDVLDIDVLEDPCVVTDDDHGAIVVSGLVVVALVVDILVVVNCVVGVVTGFVVSVVSVDNFVVDALVVDDFWVVGVAVVEVDAVVVFTDNKV